MCVCVCVRVYIYIYIYMVHLKRCRQRTFFTGLVKKIIYQLLEWKILFLYSEKNQQSVYNVFGFHVLLPSGRS